MTISLLLATFMISDVHATGLEKKTSAAYIPNRSLQRRLVLGKNWFEISGGSTYKDATGAWNPDGAELYITAKVCHTNLLIQQVGSTPRNLSIFVTV